MSNPDALAEAPWHSCTLALLEQSSSDISVHDHSLWRDSATQHGASDTNYP